MRGRAHELETIDELLAGARGGSGGVLLAVGLPCVGRTALLAVAVAAAENALVLAVRGGPSGDTVPFGGLHELLLPVSGRLAELPDSQGDALSGVLGRTATPDPDLLLIGAAVLGLLTLVATAQPLLVVVDDAHLLDAASLAVLLFVVRRLGGTRVAALLSSVEPVPPPLARAELPVLPVPGLDADAAGLLLADHGWPTSAAGRAAAVLATGGNPLGLIGIAEEASPAQRLEDLATLVTIPLGDRLRAAYGAPLADLDPDARTMVLVAAAERKGRTGTVLEAGRRLGLGPAALGPAEAAGVLQVLPSGVRFRHPLLRVAAYQEATVAERAEVHAALAAVHTGLGEQDAATWQRALGATAADEVLAADVERAAGTLEHRDGSATGAAVLHVAARLSTSEPERSRRAAAAAQAAWRSGQVDLARALTEELAAEAPVVRTQARLARLRGLIELSSGDPVAALHQLEYGAGLVAAEVPLEAAALLVVAVDAAYHAGDHQGWSRVAGAITALRDGVGRPVGPLIAATLRGELPVAGTEPLTLAAAMPDALADQGGLRHIWALGLSASGPHAALTREYGLRTCAAQRTAGMFGTLANSLVWLAGVEFHLGLWDDGAARAEEALLIARDTRQHARTAHALAVLARFAAVRGEHVRCLELAGEASGIAVPLRNRAAAAGANWAVALSALADGDPETARERLELIAAPGTSCSHRILAHVTAPDLVEAAVRTGHRELADTAAARLTGWARRATLPWAHPHRLRCAALLADDDRAEAAYSSALAILDRTDRPFDRARIALLRGESLRRGRRRSEARAVLSRAVELFEDLGAPRWAAAARVQLRGVGGAGGRTEADAATAALTPQELQVARLAAGGLSNKEIAAQLFVSPRTVGYHLYNVFPKLGVSSRAQLRDLDLGDAADGSADDDGLG